MLGGIISTLLVFRLIYIGVELHWLHLRERLVAEWLGERAFLVELAPSDGALLLLADCPSL